MTKLSKYPRVQAAPKKIPKMLRDTVCQIKGCNNMAARIYAVQTGWFRGEDEVYEVCKEHATKEIVINRHLEDFTYHR